MTTTVALPLMAIAYGSRSLRHPENKIKQVTLTIRIQIQDCFGLNYG